MFVFAVTLPAAGKAAVQGAAICTTSGPVAGTYTVTLCITGPADASVLTGDVTVTATASISPAPPAGSANPVQKLVYSLNGAYLLTDYQTPYSFSLPTAHWTDGSYTLAVVANMRDGFVTSQTAIQLTFSNGVTTPPVNTGQFTITTGTTPPLPDDPLIVAAVGDGAGGETNSQNVVNLISSWNPNLFLYLGDVYEDGSPTEFTNWYGQNGAFFSAFRSITDPTVGNHEYTNGNAPGYFDYWDNIPHYYSFNAWGWHFISLDANSAYGQLAPGTAQYQWLVNDLATDQSACTLAYWHEPVYNIGSEPANTAMQSMWSLLVNAGADLVLTGHDHDYQRWVPLDGSGQPSASGITQFVVGTGGHGIQTFVTTDSRVAAAFDSTTSPKPFGALRLRLYSSHASYDFVNTSGNFLDTGSITCKNASASTPTPTPTATSSPTPTATPPPTSTPTPTPVPTLGGNAPQKIYLPGIFR